MNRPRPVDPTNKRPSTGNPPVPNKVQRNYHINSDPVQSPNQEEYPQTPTDQHTNNDIDYYDEETQDETYIDTTDLHFLE